MFPHVLNFHVPNFKRFRWPFTFYLTYNILHSIDISSAISNFCPMRGSRDTQFGPKIKALTVHCLYLCIFPMCDWGWPKWAVAGRIVVCVCLKVKVRNEKRNRSITAMWHWNCAVFRSQKKVPTGDWRKKTLALLLLQSVARKYDMVFSFSSDLRPHSLTP